MTNLNGVSITSLNGSDLKQKIDDVFIFTQNDLANEETSFAVGVKKAKFDISTPSSLEVFSFLNFLNL